MSNVFILGAGMVGNLPEDLRQALSGRDDIVIVDRLPEFAGDFSLPVDPEPSPEYMERANWNAAIDARKATKKAKRAAIAIGSPV